MKLKLIILCLGSILLLSCISKPPGDVNNICKIFNQYPQWYRDAKDVEVRWRIPIAVQMAIIHQESKFYSRARPPHQTLLWVIPWRRPSTAFGYTQALRSTWRQYKKSEGGGGRFAARNDFADAVDFVGWYANQAYRGAAIPRNDAYRLYLAYHEGVGGYKRKTYLQKPWLIQVARKVKARSQIFQGQLNQCSIINRA